MRGDEVDRHTEQDCADGRGENSRPFLEHGALFERRKTDRPERNLNPEIINKQHAQRVDAVKRRDQRDRDVAVIKNAGHKGERPRLRVVRKAVKPGGQRGQGDSEGHADKAEQRTPKQIARSPQGFAWNHMIQNQARLKHMNE